MTVKEEISKFTHEVEGVLHEVEEVFNDVKEQMILSVRDYSMQIAFVLMGITSAILVIGSVYVWCFHHPKRPHSEDSDHQEHPSSQQSDLPNNQHSVNSDSTKSERTAEEKIADDSPQEVFENADKTEEDAGRSEQINGQVRKRTTSSNVNNNNSPAKSKIPDNNSPVKSKIPVRQKSRTSSS